MPVSFGRAGRRCRADVIQHRQLTLPMTDDRFAPLSTIMDEAHEVAITRLGDRMRVVLGALEYVSSCSSTELNDPEAVE